MNRFEYRSGTARRIPFAPERAVSLVPWVSESLAELMLVGRLAGVTDDAVLPAGAFAGLPTVGPSNAVDTGRLLGLAPDLVFLGAEHGEIAAQLEISGVAVWPVDPQTVRESFNLLWDFMNALEGPQMVERVRAMEWTCDWLERMGETRRALRRVRLLLPGYVAPSPYTVDLLRLCGGEVVPDEEYPDVLLLASTGALPDWAAELGAHAVDATLLTWPGTRVGRAFDVLPGLLAGE